MDEENLNEIVGNNIKHLRTKKGLTVRDLADALNVSISTVSNWENGKKLPRAGAIQRLADYFDVLMSEITDNKTYRERARESQFMPSLVDITDFLADPRIRIVHNEKFLTNSEREKISRIIDAVLFDNSNE